MAFASAAGGIETAVEEDLATAAAQTELAAAGKGVPAPAFTDKEMSAFMAGEQCEGPGCGSVDK